MDAAAALSLTVKSDSVVAAANDLDRFSAAATKAAAAGKNINIGQGGSIAKLVAEVQSANVKLTAIVGTLEKIASADRAAAVANDNVARSFANVDSHVTAYRQHLESMVTAQKAASTATVAADAHVVAYTAHLAGLARAQQDANAHVLAYRASLSGVAGSQLQQNAHVEAYRKHLAELPPAMDKASQSAGALRANTGNIAAQFQDIGVTAAMGMSPLLIALQQGTQLSAVFAQSGQSLGSTLAAAFRQIISPAALLTIGLVALVAVLIQYAIEAIKGANETSKLEKAIKDTQITTYALGDAQTALGNVFDLTTGKIKSQSEALRGLARAQLEMIRANAIRDQSEARKTIADQRGRNTPNIAMQPGAAGTMSMTGLGLSGTASANEQQRLLDRFSAGQLTSTQAIDSMERLRKAGKLTEDQFIKLTGAVASFGVAGENLKVYDDARKALNGDQRALQQFLNLPDPRKPRKGPKTDGEKFSDITRDAQAQIAIEKSRVEAVGMTAQASAELQQRTELLNRVTKAGIPITAARRAEVEKLSTAYADAKVAADVAAAIQGVSDDIEKQARDAEDAAKLVGLYGDALARATREMQAQKRLRDSLPRGEVVVKPNLTGGVSDDIEANARAQRLADLGKASRDAAYEMGLERGAIGLTGQALIAYNYASERKLANQRAGIAMSPAEIAAIDSAADAYAAQRYAIDCQAQAVADSREVARGFFSDIMAGARNGANAFTAMADAAVNALNRIIDKLLDRTLDSALNNLFPSQAGGLQRASQQVIASNPAIFAKGGAFGTPTRFAQGGAFTNSIVTSPTLFRFARGAALGEMGEAGPEAVMPLKRGPNGALGVEMHGGGRPQVRMGDIHNTFEVSGAIDQGQIVAMIRQGGAATYDQVKRDLQTLLQQLDTDGGFAS